MAIVRAENGRLIRQMAGELLVLEPWGENSLRVRATFNAELPTDDWALLPPQETPAVQIETDGRSGRIRCGNISATVGPGGDLHFFNQKGECFLREQWRDRGELDGRGLYDITSALHIPGRHFLPHPGGDYQLTVRFEPNPGEKIFGMGQYQDGCLDKMGTTLELAHRNSQASVPFFISNKGYGMLWNNPAIGRVTFAKNTTEWAASATKAMDYWICADDSPAQIEAAYTAAVGRAPMMPDYAMGFWQCKLRYMTQEELLSVAREYKRRQLPLSVIVCDFFHWPYQGDWRFDPQEWPDPQAMVDELSELGIELMVSIWPYVDTRSENYSEMYERGLLARVERGVPISMYGNGNTLPFDPTNPEARRFVWNVVKKNYYDLGIRLFWLDEAEPECAVYDFDNYRYHAGSVLQAGNIYPVRYAQTFYDGLLSAGVKYPLNLLRCAWAGSARYGALVWSGDIGTTFETLRQQLAAGLSMAIAGIPWWTTDIGGFHGGDQNDPAYRELLVRWFQFGAFCPVFRLHGCREHGHPSGSPDKAPTGGPNEVWSYGEDVYAILKNYIFLRERLHDYIKEAMKSASLHGTPPMRPLWYDFPSDARAWEVEDCYLFGSSLLVAPILYPGARTRDIYLPKGEVWTDPYTDIRYQGGRSITVDAPLERIPVLVRGDARLPLL